VEDKASEVRCEVPTSYREEAPARLADGTRRDIQATQASGICITTSCQTVDQFVAMFQRYCDGSAIFIADTQRPVGASVMFSFELRDKTPVLVGKGTVTEQFTDMQNPFGRAGSLVSIRKLTRDSVAVMQRMLAERKHACVEQHTRVTQASDIKIPSPVRQAGAKPRASTVLGMPIVAKPPGDSSFKIPSVPRRIEPRPDGVPQPVPTHDTVRDEIPFALRHQLMLLEQRAKVMPVQELCGVDFDLDSAWDDPEPAVPVIEPAVPEQLRVEASAPEELPVEPAIASPASIDVQIPIDEIPIEPVVEEELPVAAQAFAAAAVPVSIAHRWWRTPVRWAVRVAIVSVLFVGAATATWLAIPSQTLAGEPSRPVSSTPLHPSSGLLSSALTAPAAAPPAAPQIAAPAPISQPPRAAPRPAPHPAAKAPARGQLKHVAKQPAPCRSLDCL
jgi:hypothetical protein